LRSISSIDLKIEEIV